MSFSSNKSHFINIRAYFPCNPHPSRLNRAIFTLVESAYNEHPPPITGPAEGAPYQIQCSRVSDYNSRSHHKVGVGLEVGAGEHLARLDELVADGHEIVLHMHLAVKFRVAVGQESGV